MGPYSGKRAVEKCEYIFARLGGMKRRVYIERDDESGLKIASPLVQKKLAVYDELRSSMQRLPSVF